ncbi:MAG: endolytic transglycosylase MltG [Acidobacteria bacterium]|nr:endolytic transglycosylase MltG [Acidobacteriota bacterium]
MPDRFSRPSLGRRIGLALLAAVAGVAALLLWPYQGYSGQAVVVIEQGLGRRAIADRLAAQGVLPSRWPFLLYAYAQPHRTLKAGEYVFDRPVSAAGVFAKLARGEVHLYPLTIPEGYTRWDIAAEVERLQLASRQAFLHAAEKPDLIRDLAPEATTLEGYLFPDTYHFARPADPAAMARSMVEHFRQVYGALRERGADSRLPAGPGGTLTTHRLVTLASLVEKETGVPQERGLIAAVFYNRLERRLPLQCDPTVIYAARLAARGQFDGVINVSDLERKSPYNTYLYAGLPPGPIANPGRAALEAVLNPPRSDFLYFVSNTRGGHDFARTGAEHERNVARYRRLRARQERKAGSNGNPR